MKSAVEANELCRCPWGTENPLYIKYHDEEWGVPVHDDRRHFEFLILEAFQAGLSWLLILKKRDNFQRAFADFDPIKVARFSQTRIETLMNDTGIIRNRRKIEAAVNNAQRFLEVREEFGSFDRYIWDFVKGKPVINSWEELSHIPAKTVLAEKVSEDLKKRGFKFLGPTVVYAHMQAVGLVNDHLVSCFRHAQLS